MRFLRSARLLVCALGLVLLVGWLPVALSGCSSVLQPVRSDDAVESGAALAEPTLVRVAVSWVAVPLMRDLEAAYANQASQVSLDVTVTSAQVALDLVSAGEADLAIVEQQPTLPSATATSTGSSVQLATQALASDAIVLIVPRDHALTQISTAQLARLYAGYTPDWSDLGAGSGPVEFVTRESGAAARTLFESAVMNGEPISSAAVVMPNDQGVLDYVEGHPGAIGYLPLAYVTEDVHVVALDSQLPDIQHLSDGTYPLTYTLLLCTAPSTSTDAQRFANFALSTRGCRAIRQHYACER